MIDDFNYDYTNKWLNEEMKFHFELLEIHYSIIDFRFKKRLKFIKKYPNIDEIKLLKKIDNSLKRSKLSKKLNKLLTNKFQKQFEEFKKY